MPDMLEHYRARVAGTNIDPRSLLSTDYFNHFNTVVMLFGMLPDAPELLEEIDTWQFITYTDHFKTSGLDFAKLAVEAYAHVPPNLLKRFEHKLDEMRTFIEMSRLGLRQLLTTKDISRFNDMALRISRELQNMIDDGGAIVHGYEESLDQSAIDKMF